MADLGQRVAALRRRNGMSQRDLATVLRRSDSWVSQVERDLLPVERVSVLQRLADTLAVSIQDLRPETAPVPEPAERSNDLDTLRLAMTGHPAPALLLAADEPTSADLAELRQRVETIWELTHASRFTQLNEPHIAPARLGGQLAARQPTSPSTGEPASGTDLPSGSRRVPRQDKANAAWVAADRAVTAAEHSGDHLAALAGPSRMAHASITLRWTEQAERVAQGASSAYRNT